MTEEEIDKLVPRDLRYDVDPGSEYAEYLPSDMVATPDGDWVRVEELAKALADNDSLMGLLDQYQMRCDERDEARARVAELERPENRGIGDGDIAALFREKDELRAEVERLSDDLTTLNSQYDDLNLKLVRAVVALHEVANTPSDFDMLSSRTQVLAEQALGEIEKDFSTPSVRCARESAIAMGLDPNKVASQERLDVETGKRMSDESEVEL